MNSPSKWVRTRRRWPDPRFQATPTPLRRLERSLLAWIGSRPLDRKVRGLLGLARRAGVLDVGVGAAREAVRSGRARVVILARDGAAGQLGKLLPLLEHREVPRRWVQRRDDLGGALGMPGVSAVAVTANTFADQFLAVLSAGADTAAGTTEEGREAKEESGTNAGC